MTLEQQFIKAVKSRNRALAEQCVQAMLQRKMVAALTTEKMRVGGDMLREAYCVVYRTGGTANFQWKRTCSMSKPEAEKALRDVVRMGYKGHIADYNQSVNIGLPDTYGLDEDPLSVSMTEGASGTTRMQVQNEYDKQRKAGKSEREAAREAERTLGVKDVRVSSDGKTVSYFTESTYNPPTNWDKGFQYPIRIGGGGSETPFLKNGTWYLRVWDAKANKHYNYNYSTDMMELDEAVQQEDFQPAVTYCGLCRKPVMQGHRPVGDIVDHFVYDSMGDLDYIELFHRACALKKNWQIDSQGHVVGTKRAGLAEAVIIGDDMPAKEVQRVFDEHGDIIATEKLCGIKKLRVSQQGDVLSYMREGRLVEAMGPNDAHEKQIAEYERQIKQKELQGTFNDLPANWDLKEDKINGRLYDYLQHTEQAKALVQIFKSKGMTPAYMRVTGGVPFVWCNATHFECQVWPNFADGCWAYGFYGTHGLPTQKGNLRVNLMDAPAAIANALTAVINKSIDVAMERKIKKEFPGLRVMKEDKLPIVHAGSPLRTNAQINREHAMKMFKAGMTPKDIARAFPEVFKLDSEGKLGQKYDYELGDGSGRYETKRMITADAVKAAISKHKG
jgi:hypothetical protein